jgi:hypothetical protein
MAAMTSPAVMPKAAIFSGSSQTRSEYCRSPKMVMSPTPAEAEQHVANPRAGVAGDVELVVGLVRREHVHDHHQVGRALPRGDAESAHLLRQARLGDGDAVLDSTCAASRSVPSAKVTVSDIAPSPVE